MARKRVRDKDTSVVDSWGPINNKGTYEEVIADLGEKWIEDYQSQDTGSLYDWNQSTIDEFKDIPVETLLMDPYFLNLKDMIYPGVLEDILDLWAERKKRDVNLNLLLHGIGSGKSMCASIISWLLVYELCMHKNPQKHFGLADNSVIAVMLLSRTETQTRRVIYSYMWDRFQSQFNKDYFPVNPKFSRELRIERNRVCVYAGTSSALSALGYNVYCLSGDTKIRLADGSSKSLLELENKGPLKVKGFDIKTQRFRNVEAFNVTKSGHAMVYKLELEDGSIIKGTADHPILTSDLKYKSLIDFTLDDFVLTDQGPVNFASIRELGVQVVYDVIESETSNFMLDNGVIVHNSGVVDEANFLEVIEDSKKHGIGEIYDAAEEMENAIMNRMTSRFMIDGKIPGLLSMISSPLYPDSYMERKIEEIEEKGLVEMNAFYRRRPTWEAKGAKSFPDFYERNEYFEVDLETLKIIKENIRRNNNGN